MLVRERERENRNFLTRNSNIELLRIISMLMIVAYHYAIFGFYAEDIMYNGNKFFVDIFGMGGKIGTDAFVLISGYYMINSHFTLKKLMSFMGQVWFYTVGTLLVFTLLNGPSEISSYAVKSALFPLLTSHYWFASYYVLLMLLSPFLNTLLHRLDRQQHGFLCLFLFALTTFIPEFLHLNFVSGSLPLFVALYVCAAYCRLHISTNDLVGNRSLLWAIAALLLCIARICITDYTAQQTMNSSALEGSVNFMGAYSPFAFIIAFLMLLACCCRKPKHKAFVALTGNLTFGVYLCHANLLLNTVLWQDILHTASYSSSPWLFLHALISTALIFFACCVVELLRQQMFAPIWNRLCDKLSPALSRILSRLLCVLLSLLHFMIGDKPMTWQSIDEKNHEI